jgi:hypothetical protein
MAYEHVPYKQVKPQDKVIGLDLCKLTVIILREKKEAYERTNHKPAEIPE